MKIETTPFQDAEDAVRYAEMKRKLSEIAPLLYVLGNVSKHFRRRVAEQAKDFDITVPQWKVLAQLSVTEGISQSALAGLCEIDAMTVSGILDRLEVRGLAVRAPNPRDSRAKIVRSTPLANDRVAEIRAVAKGVYAEAVQGISPADQDLALRTLTRIADNLADPSGDRI